MNALIENGVDPKEYGAQFDSISICLSKGLGAPVGSVLIGSKDFIYRSRRVRKAFGGGMRQAGIIAAGGLYALKNNVIRLREDHSNARVLEYTLKKLEWVNDIIPVETNIVVAILKDALKRDKVINQLEENNVKIMAFGPGMLRFVTHLDISSSDMDQTIEVLKKIEL